MKTKKAPRVRWVKPVCTAGSHYCDIGIAYIKAESEAAARMFAHEANRELSRLVAARDKRRAR